MKRNLKNISLMMLLATSPVASMEMVREAPVERENQAPSYATPSGKFNQRFAEAQVAPTPVAKPTTFQRASNAADRSLNLAGEAISGALDTSPKQLVDATGKLVEPLVTGVRNAANTAYTTTPRQAISGAARVAGQAGRNISSVADSAALGISSAAGRAGTAISSAVNEAGNKFQGNLNARTFGDYKSTGQDLGLNSLFGDTTTQETPAPSYLEQTKNIASNVYHAPGALVDSLGGQGSFVTGRTGSLRSVANTTNRALGQAGRGISSAAGSVGETLVGVRKAISKSAEDATKTITGKDAAGNDVTVTVKDLSTLPVRMLDQTLSAISNLPESIGNRLLSAKTAVMNFFTMTGKNPRTLAPVEAKAVTDTIDQEVSKGENNVTTATNILTRLSNMFSNLFSAAPVETTAVYSPSQKDTSNLSSAYETV